MVPEGGLHDHGVEGKKKIEVVGENQRRHVADKKVVDRFERLYDSEGFAFVGGPENLAI